jgi:hypothetical protein
MAQTTDHRKDTEAMNHDILNTMSRQIGTMTLLAVSGGRRVAISENVLELPVGKGYTVRVTYNACPDLYTVERVFRRGGKEWQKGQLTDVYADELAEACYGASCFISYPYVVGNRWAEDPE